MPTTYLVLSDDPNIREKLLPYCTKVGVPGAITSVVIVESNATLETLKNIPGVIDVNKDAKLRPSTLPEYTIQYDPSNWFLPSLSQSVSEYKYSRTGANVDLYIVDTGVYSDNVEFEDRVEHLWSFDGLEYGDNVVTPFHGTMCAGCAGGKQHGVAKQVNILSARTDWRLSNTMKSLDQVASHHLSKTNNRPSVLSMSFSTLTNGTFARAMDVLINAGVVCIASTGNSGTSGAEYPAANDIVLGVSALQQNPQNPLSVFPASYSNYGPGTDIWAPGEKGVVAGYKTVTGTQSARGTSAACPVVAGLMAMYLDGKPKLSSRAEVQDALSGFLTECTVQLSLGGKFSSSTQASAYSVFGGRDPSPPIGNSAPRAPGSIVVY